MDMGVTIGALERDADVFLVQPMRPRSVVARLREVVVEIRHSWRSQSMSGVRDVLSTQSLPRKKGLSLELGGTMGQRQLKRPGS